MVEFQDGAGNSVNTTDGDATNQTDVDTDDIDADEESDERRPRRSVSPEPPEDQPDITDPETESATGAMEEPGQRADAGEMTAQQQPEITRGVDNGRTAEDTPANQPTSGGAEAAPQQTETSAGPTGTDKTDPDIRTGAGNEAPLDREMGDVGPEPQGSQTQNDRANEGETDQGGGRTAEQSGGQSGEQRTETGRTVASGGGLNDVAATDEEIGSGRGVEVGRTEDTGETLAAATLEARLRQRFDADADDIKIVRGENDQLQARVRGELVRAEFRESVASQLDEFGQSDIEVRQENGEITASLSADAESRALKEQAAAENDSLDPSDIQVEREEGRLTAGLTDEARRNFLEEQREARVERMFGIEDAEQGVDFTFGPADPLADPRTAESEIQLTERGRKDIGSDVTRLEVGDVTIRRGSTGEEIPEVGERDRGVGSRLTKRDIVERLPGVQPQTEIDARDGLSRKERAALKRRVASKDENLDPSDVTVGLESPERRQTDTGIVGGPEISVGLTQEKQLERRKEAVRDALQEDPGLVPGDDFTVTRTRGRVAGAPSGLQPLQTNITAEGQDTLRRIQGVTDRPSVTSRFLGNIKRERAIEQEAQEGSFSAGVFVGGEVIEDVGVDITRTLDEGGDLPGPITAPARTVLGDETASDVFKAVPLVTESGEFTGVPFKNIGDVNVGGDFEDDPLGTGIAIGATTAADPSGTTINTSTEVNINPRVGLPGTQGERISTQLRNVLVEAPAGIGVVGSLGPRAAGDIGLQLESTVGGRDVDPDAFESPEQVGAQTAAVGQKTAEGIAKEPLGAATEAAAGFALRGVSPVRVRRFDLPQRTPDAPDTTLSRRLGARAQGLRRGDTDVSQDIDLDAPDDVTGPTKTVSGVRLETPAAARRLGLDRGGRTIFGFEGRRPTAGSPGADLTDVDIEKLGSGGGKAQQGGVFEPRTEFEADVIEESAGRISRQQRERVGAVRDLLEEGDTVTGGAATREPRDVADVVREAEEIPGDVDAEEVADALGESDATLFGSGAVAAQAKDFRAPGDIDIVVPDKTAAKENILNALEGTSGDLSAFDIKEPADFAGLEGGELFGFGRRSQTPITTKRGVRVNPIGEELQRKAGASGFVRQEGVLGDEVDIGPRPNPGGFARTKDVTDAAEIAESLDVDQRTVAQFRSAFGLRDEALPDSGSPLNNIDLDIALERFARDDRGQMTIGDDATGLRRADDDAGDELSDVDKSLDVDSPASTVTRRFDSDTPAASKAALVEQDSSVSPDQAPDSSPSPAATPKSDATSPSTVPDSSSPSSPLPPASGSSQPAGTPTSDTPTSPPPSITPTSPLPSIIPESPTPSSTPTSPGSPTPPTTPSSPGSPPPTSTTSSPPASSTPTSPTPPGSQEQPPTAPTQNNPPFEQDRKDDEFDDLQLLLGADFEKTFTGNVASGEEVLSGNLREAPGRKVEVIDDDTTPEILEVTATGNLQEVTDTVEEVNEGLGQ